MAKKHRYTWVPAGFDSLCGPRKLGVKFMPFEEGAFTLSKDKKTIRTEDRIVTTDKKKVKKCDRIYRRGKWDEQALTRQGLEIVMFNATSPRSKQQPRDHGVDVLVDSGGYQLKTGVKKFLDPRKIAERHNDVGTIGISLELPVTPAEQHILLPRLTQMQRRNNEMFKTVLDTNVVDGMNVCHGFNLKVRKEYLESVWDPYFKRLAVAGLIGKPATDIIAHMVWLITRLGTRVKHYHMLGVSGYQIFFTLAYLNKMFPDVLITSDSSTYIMHAKNALFFDPASFSSLNFSKSQGSVRHTVTPTMRIPCSCEFCEGVGHVQTALEGPSGLVHLWVFHNLRETVRRVKVINDVVHSSTDSEILDYAGSINTNLRDVLRVGYRLANNLANASKQKQTEILRPWFNTGSTLFSKAQDVKKWKPQTKTAQRFVNILDTYDKFHDEHGVK